LPEINFRPQKTKTALAVRAYSEGGFRFCPEPSSPACLASPRVFFLARIAEHMADLSRSVPPASRILAESVAAYRAGFPGVARAFLPVFAIFAAGQVGLAVWGEATTFGGLMARAAALAGLGLLEILAQVIATAGLFASAGDLPRVTVVEIYRRGARAFWPSVWVGALVASILAVLPVAALLVSPVVVKVAASLAGAILGPTSAAVTATLAALAAFALVVIAAELVVAARLIFALPLATSGVARGLAALETSAGLSDGRAWRVAARLAAGAAATILATAPFALVLSSTAEQGSGSMGSPWAWSLFAAGYLLVSIPFTCIFLVRLLGSLRDTPAERAASSGPRPWVRAAAWVGAAAWATLILKVVL
jgi:hypothetical protein